MQRWVVCGGAVLASEEASRILYPSPSPGPFAPTPAPPPLLQESFPDLTTLSARPQVSSCQAGLSASASLWVLGVGPSSQSQASAFFLLGLWFGSFSWNLSKEATKQDSTGW